MAVAGLIAAGLAFAAPPSLAADDVALTFAGTGTTGQATATFTEKRPGPQRDSRGQAPEQRLDAGGRQAAARHGTGDLLADGPHARGVRLPRRRRGVDGELRVLRPAETEWAPGPLEPKHFGSPVMRITTENGVSITSREVYVRATMTLGGVEHPLRIRGRGHSTWPLPEEALPAEARRERLASGHAGRQGLGDARQLRRPFPCPERRGARIEPADEHRLEPAFRLRRAHPQRRVSGELPAHGAHRGRARWREQVRGGAVDRGRREAGGQRGPRLPQPS